MFLTTILFFFLFVERKYKSFFIFDNLYLLRCKLNVKNWKMLQYINESGSCPFENWLENLKDIKGRAVIRKKINLL